MHQEEPCKKAKAKSIEMMRMLLPSQWDIFVKEVLETMETFMTTQAAHGQLLDELITEVAALRMDFFVYRSAFPPLPSSDP